MARHAHLQARPLGVWGPARHLTALPACVGLCTCSPSLGPLPRAGSTCFPHQRQHKATPLAISDPLPRQLQRGEKPPAASIRTKSVYLALDTLPCHLLGASAWPNGQDSEEPVRNPPEAQSCLEVPRPVPLLHRHAAHTRNRSEVLSERSLPFTPPPPDKDTLSSNPVHSPHCCEACSPEPADRHVRNKSTISSNGFFQKPLRAVLSS